MAECDVSVLFSDLDGTLVHYPKEFLEYADIIDENDDENAATIQYKETKEIRECVTLTSMTGGKAYMSKRTCELVKTLRQMGTVFVIITGARSSTYQARRQFLPQADYEFFENGGRKLSQGVVDWKWTNQFHTQIGTVNESGDDFIPDMPPPEKRDGTLWELYNKLIADTWKIDARNYLTNFRVDVNKSEGKTEMDFEQVVQKECIPRGLASSYNLGKADIYPATSGKANAAKHIVDILNIDRTNTVAIFDDDNDLELGVFCGRSFLPGVTHPSVLNAMKTQPTWTLTERRGVLGTEEALEAIIKMRTEAMNRNLVHS